MICRVVRGKEYEQTQTLLFLHQSAGTAIPADFLFCGVFPYDHYTTFTAICQAFSYYFRVKTCKNKIIYLFFSVTSH